MIDQQVEAIWPRLTTEPAYPTLRIHLALRALGGADPLHLLLDTAASGELTTAHDRAAVLDWRLHNDTAEGPLPWLPAIPPALGEQPEWGMYLDARAHRVTNLASQVRHDATATGTTTRPIDADLRGDIAVWRAALGVPATDDRPTGPPHPGPPHPGVDAAAHQSHLNSRLRHATEDSRAPTWRTVLPEALRADPFVENLERRLTTLDRTGVDPVRLIADALAQPQPLPVEHPAGALWWRIVRRVDPTALRGACSSAPAEDQRQRPESQWIAQLTEAVPGIDANLGWPRLLDTLNRAHADGYDVPQLLTSALTTPSEMGQRGADDLRWRILDTTDPDPRRTPPPIVVPQPETQHKTHQGLRSADSPAPGAPRTKPLNSFSSRRGGPLRMAA